MPGRGNAGHVRGKQEHDHGGHQRGTDPSNGPATSDRGGGSWSPGHMKKAAGRESARDFAPGHGGTPAGRRGAGQEEGEALA